VLDLKTVKTVLAWRDEVGVRRGILYEDGKVEFEEWSVRPHEAVIDIFENIFKSQFVCCCMNPRNPTFEGKHNQGKNTPFWRIKFNDARYELPWGKETTRQCLFSIPEPIPTIPLGTCSIATRLRRALANHRPRSG